MHVSENSCASESSFETSDIVRHATRLMLYSEQLQSQRGETKICTFRGDVIHLLCELPLALACNLDIVYAWNINIKDDQLFVTYMRGLYRLTFGKKSNNMSEREEEFYSEAHQAGTCRAERNLDLNSIEKQVGFFLSNYWKEIRPFKVELSV